MAGRLCFCAAWRRRLIGALNNRGTRTNTLLLSGGCWRQWLISMRDKLKRLVSALTFAALLVTPAWRLAAQQPSPSPVVAPPTPSPTATPNAALPTLPAPGVPQDQRREGNEMSAMDQNSAGTVTVTSL